jgi:hypothetical protein
VGPLSDGEKWRVDRADCLDWLRAMPPDSVDLVFGSPPYEECRLYLENGTNMGISRKTDAWVAWMVDVYRAAQAACRGLVAFVVAGQTRQYRWSAGPALLMAELHRAGLNLRNPPIFHRYGIFGSGGPDWLRSDYEWVVCTSRRGKLPWSDNTAMGHPPKWGPGGEASHRLSSGTRVNQWGHTGARHVGPRMANGERAKTTRPSHVQVKAGRGTRGMKNGDTVNGNSYEPPDLANPGNVIKCLVGGNVMGDPLCHENEAPFPEKLAEFFVRSFAPPGGVVCDPFSGSGTTAAVAVRCGRRALACDLRQSQAELSRKRIGNVTAELFAGP